jgi:hypothetical protein
MAKTSSQTDDERDLHLILSAIASPPDDQIEVYHGICIAHALEGRFEYGSVRVLRSSRDKPVSPECRAALEDLAERFKRISVDPAYECHDDTYIAESPLWADVRQSALRALQAFGWLREEPRRETVFNDRYFTPHGLSKVTEDDPRLEKGQAFWGLQPDSLEALDEFLPVLSSIGFPLQEFELYATPEDLQDQARSRLERFIRS